MQNDKEWFGEWFNTPFYHILYQNRDQLEAERFIQNVSHYFKFNRADKILDLACGKGRHAIYLNQLGYDVVGVDLSEKSINVAKKLENPRLQFLRHDMRTVFKPNTFDYILNLFTSFGYFDTEVENIEAILAVSKSLKKGGKLLLDFFNTEKVLQELIPYEIKKVDNIHFEIRKTIEGQFIIKNIDFEYEHQSYHFTEKVMAIDYNQFMRYFFEASLTPFDPQVRAFGDYDLRIYDPKTSDRMIFVMMK